MKKFNVIFMCLLDERASIGIPSSPMEFNSTGGMFFALTEWLKGRRRTNEERLLGAVVFIEDKNEGKQFYKYKDPSNNTDAYSIGSFDIVNIILESKNGEIINYVPRNKTLGHD